MRNFQDTFERRKRSFISAFFNLNGCTFNDLINYISRSVGISKCWFISIAIFDIDNARIME